jgi:hypothetical protein
VEKAASSNAPLDPAFFRGRGAHILLSENRVIGYWGDVEGLLGSNPPQGEHVGRWHALRDSAKLRAVVEGAPWPEDGLKLARRLGTDLNLVSFFIDGKAPTAS